jgi:hypothetical protein
MAPHTLDEQKVRAFMEAYRQQIASATTAKGERKWLVASLTGEFQVVTFINNVEHEHHYRGTDVAAAVAAYNQLG